MIKKDLLFPQLIRIGVSRICNHRCIMCWNYSPKLKNPKSSAWKNIMINTETLLKAIAEAKEIGFKQILLSGRGEPFAHPDILSIIKKSANEGLGVILQTNLSLADPFVLAGLLKKIKHKSIICVNISAARTKTYDKIHRQRRKDEYANILSKIKYLRSKKIRVRFVFIVIRENYQEIEEAFSLNKKLGTFLHLELADYIPNSGVGRASITKKVEREIINILVIAKKRYGSDKSNMDDFLNQLKYQGIGMKKVRRCLIGNNFCSIDEIGNMQYCFNMENDFFMGNIADSSLKEVWNSDKYKMMRARLEKGVFFPSCSQYCLTNHSLSKARGSNFKLRFFIDSGISKPYA